MGWPAVPLETLLTGIQPGFASGRHNTEGEGIPHFRPMNVSTKGRIDRSVMKYIDASVGRPDIRLSTGDVLFNNTNSPELVGKTALFEGNDSPAFSNHMTRLRVDRDRLDPRYLALRLHQAWREGWFAARCNNHVSQASIGRDLLKAFEIELPPLEIQREIVGLSDDVGALCSSSLGHLSAARKSVERFRQAVLTAAYSGQLTHDWRQTHGAATEAARAFLHRLSAARNEVVKKSPLDPFIDEDVPKKPDSWEWASADALTTLITKGTTPPAAEMSPGLGEIPYLKVYNLTFDGAVDFTVNPTFVPRGVHGGLLKRSRLHPGDLLLNIVGPPLGKVGVVPDSHPEWNMNQAIAVFRLLAPFSTQYLKFWFLSPQLLSYFVRRAKATAGQYNLTLEICREIPVPIPPLAEQAEIVRRVEVLLQSADKVLAGIEDASKLVDRSYRGVLTKAFRGDLAISEGAA